MTRKKELINLINATLDEYGKCKLILKVEGKHRNDPCARFAEIISKKFDEKASYINLFNDELAMIKRKGVEIAKYEVKGWK